MTSVRLRRIDRTASATIQALAIMLLLAAVAGSATRVWRSYHAALRGEVVP